MKKKVKIAAFLVSVMAADASIAADNIQLSGVWKEKDGTAVYSFLRDHEFEYWNTYSSRDEVHKKGTWQTGADMYVLGWRWRCQRQFDDPSWHRAMLSPRVFPCKESRFEFTSKTPVRGCL